MIHTIVPRRREAPLLDVYQLMTGASRMEAEQVVSQLIQGEETVVTRLIDELYVLACIARDAPEVATLLTERPPGFDSRLKHLPSATEFTQRFEHFLATYGDWTGIGYGSETSFERLPWRETPQRVLEIVAKYLPLPDGTALESPATARQRARQQRDARVEALCASVADPQMAVEFRRRLEYARRNATFTDEHNYYIDQLAEGQYAQALRYAGRWLAARGDLAQPDEVSWLESTEILSALRSPGPQPLHNTIAVRKRKYADWSELQAPAVLGLPSASLPARTPSPQADLEEKPTHEVVQENLLVGQGVSPGRRSGRARIIPDSAYLPEVNSGDVLVATTAGPLWTPIFPTLAGEVLDGGS